MNDMSGAQARLADVVAVLDQLYDPRWAESWYACARSDRSAPATTSASTSRPLDLTPLHRRPEHLHDLGDHPV